ncbi:MAG: hypothetical protein HFJ75_01240 [Eggerthellaceae bacterium]|nr:hypothetical protein [Eggerthellaceae bacterium]
MRTNDDNLIVADDHLARVLEGRALLLEDGGMGTMLQRTGLLAPGAAPETLCLDHPEAVTAVHRAYVEAGSELVTTNTFGASAPRLGGDEAVAEVFAAAVACARAAGARYVGASLGPSGQLLEPWGDLDPDDAYDLFATQARAAADAGADVIIVETMADLGEMTAAASAALDVTRLPVFATMTFGPGGRTMMGTAPDEAARALAALGVHAAGLNCSVGPREAAPLAAAMAPLLGRPLIVKPNAGLPRLEGGETVYDVDAAGFARDMAAVLDAGAAIVGGCCGTDPAFIAALAPLVAARS